MNTEPTPTLAAVAPATTCCASWIPGDKPDTPKGSSTLMWVTLRHKESGKLSVGVLSYHNGHVMPCADHCDPPDCAVPHNPEKDGYCEEYEWTCWSDGYCEYCETEWVWHSHYSEIIAHAPVTKPEPFRQNEQGHPARSKRDEIMKYCTHCPTPEKCVGSLKCQRPTAKEKAEARRSAAACSAWFPMESAPKDREILACWGTVASGPMAYDIVKHLWGEKWKSVMCSDRYPADAFHLQGWMDLPALPNAKADTSP